jgi:hypothetical protein
VLNFSDRAFANFFSDELGINIDDRKYFVEGTSKAKRLRCFLQTSDKTTVIRALNALWEYREIIRTRSGEPEKLKEPHEIVRGIIAKLGDIASFGKMGASPPSAGDHVKFVTLRDELLKLTDLDAQARGYAFEAFLKQLFDTFGLAAREGFRLRGEQIDGSFVLNKETYLLEAKWQNAQCGNGELHAFHGKIEQKAAWARGLFISYSGFTEDGLHAFGRGKRVICMDGWDLSETLQRELSLGDVLERKVRRAAETGMALVRVRDLIGL